MVLECGQAMETLNLMDALRNVPTLDNFYFNGIYGDTMGGDDET